MSSRIRILHSVGHLARGGIETWLHQMVSRLDQTKFEHHVLVWTDKEEPFTSKFVEAGARVIPCLNRSNPVHLVKNLRRIIAENGPYDVLHTHGTHFQGFLIALATGLGIKKSLAHSHNDLRPKLEHASLAYRLYSKAGYGAMRKFSAAGLGVSDKAAECAFGEDWQNDPRWGLLYCGIDFERFFIPTDPNLREQLGIPAGRQVIGHVGRYVPQKNHEFMVDIAAELARRGAPIHFLLIGDGPLRPAITQKIAEQNLTDRFTFLADTPEVAPYLVSAMDGFILPSIHEGLPLAPVEAQAAGLPTLLSFNVAAETVVSPNTGRRLAKDADASAWADAIENLPPRNNGFDTDFRQILQNSRFNVDHCASGLADQYQKLAGR